MIYPNKTDFLKLCEDANVVPVTTEVYSDTKTPIGIFMHFASQQNSFLLESVEGGEKWARYSFIGRNPYMTFSARGEDITIMQGEQKQRLTGNPFEELKKIFARFKYAKIDGLPRLSGGAVGYFGYDTVRYIEKLPAAPPDDMDVPDCYLMFCDEIIAYDHLKQKVMVIINVHINGEPSVAYDTASARIAKIAQEIEAPVKQIARTIDETADTEFASNFTKEEFCSAVQKAKQYIYDGDIFQVVLSQRLAIETNVDPFDVYRVLRSLNPSPYLYYLRLPDTVIVGSSPELLVRVEEDVVETCPIAGTRPQRGKTRIEDAELADDLLQDEKELAEHTMLVDLGRNDIGKVAQFGSVKVENPMHIEKYSHVMHIVSNVKGKKRPDAGAFDVLGAVMPAGTLSGAPKVRAMEIINELEKSRRGIYGGSIGYIGFDGHIDMCITIRTMVFHGGKAYLQAGAGVVADSVPETEYEETLSKARALVKALQKAGEIS